MTSSPSSTPVPDTSLSGRFVLIAGSANAGCSADKLRRGHAFVRALTRQLLERGAGVVTFASGTPSHSSNPELSIVFGETILSEVGAYLAGTVVGRRPCVRIVTSSKALTSKLSTKQRNLIARLSELGAAEIAYIPDEVHTGGNIRDKQVEWADGLVVLSGGKGVADLARKCRTAGVPIIPLDLDVGSSGNDGEGAIALYRRALVSPNEFLLLTGARFPSIAPAMSLEASTAEPYQVATRVCDLLAAEVVAQLNARPVDVLVLTALPVELQEARAAFGVTPETQPSSTPHGTLVWTVDVLRPSDNDALRAAIVCLGGAGNVDAAAIASEAISRLSPKLVIMVGIAAGLRGKCKLGDVILSDRVVAYESSATLEANGSISQAPRPDIYRLDYRTEQSVTAYVSGGPTLVKRVTELRAQLGGQPPEDCDSQHVALELRVRSATIASGEKLLRSPTTFLQMRSIHGKVEVAEMEAVGIAAACRTASTPFLVVRGICDHGDAAKDDRFHRVAAIGAAAVAADFVRFGVLPASTAMGS